MDAAVRELRARASALAAQQLAGQVDDAFKWEEAAAELRRTAASAAATPTWSSPATAAEEQEQALMQAWDKAGRAAMATDMPLGTPPQSGGGGDGSRTWGALLQALRDAYPPTTPPAPGPAADSLLAASAVLAGLATLPGSVQAVGEEVLASGAEAASAVQAPGWLGPFLLAFPVLGYSAFSVYRDKVNPRATLLDWAFIMTAVFIVLNLLTSIFLKVRLY
eukprot:SM000043S15845  [mRNA]  locus=s43:533007:534218:+ [translate_table: standard]